MSKYHDITIALAALIQSCHLINELATYGQCSHNSLQTCLASIYKVNSESVNELYGGAEGVKLGLIDLTKMFNQQPGSLARNTIQYLIKLISLEKRLMKDKVAMTLLRNNLNQLEFSNESNIADLASLYQKVTHQLEQPIMVIGKPEYLHQADIMEQIRALLLAGLRAAVLWRQVGGNRLQFFFKRRQMAKACNQLLEQA